jgi:hypothetical protein
MKAGTVPGLGVKSLSELLLITPDVSHQCEG